MTTDKRDTCNVDHSSGPRAAGLGGECAKCRHRPPLHERGCPEARCDAIEADVERIAADAVSLGAMSGAAVLAAVRPVVEANARLAAELESRPRSAMPDWFVKALEANERIDAVAEIRRDPHAALEKIEGLSADLAICAGELDTCRVTLAEERRDVDTLGQERDAARAELAETQAQLARVARESDATEASLRAQIAALTSGDALAARPSPLTEAEARSLAEHIGIKLGLAKDGGEEPVVTATRAILGWHADRGDVPPEARPVPEPRRIGGGPAEARARGLYGKFDVRRADGSSEPGCKHERCDYLVLDWIHDRFAVPAGRAYANACEDEYPALAADIRARAMAARRHALLHEVRPSGEGQGHLSMFDALGMAAPATPSGPPEPGPPPGFWDTGVAVERESGAAWDPVGGRPTSPDVLAAAAHVVAPRMAEMDVTTGEAGPHTAAARAAVDVELAAIEAVRRCERGEHRRAGETMPGSCADCGVDWADLDAEEPPDSVDPADLCPGCWIGGEDPHVRTEGCSGARAERLCVAVLATNAADEVLLVRNRKRAWELPGGGVHEGEAPTYAAHREVEEETGVRVALEDDPTEILGSPKPGAAYRSRILVYRARAEGEPKAGDDAALAEWLTAAEVLKGAEDASLSDLASRAVLLAWARETAPSVDPQRPKVGAWVTSGVLDSLYDDRGQYVGSVSGDNDCYCWFATRPFLGMAEGRATTREQARSDALDVLATWADVSAARGAS